MKALLENSILGKETMYPTSYDPSLLFPIERKLGRDVLGIKNNVPFYGSDVWNAYELSWLDMGGKPQVAIASFEFSCNTTRLIESKSFKLYLNSFAFVGFEDSQKVQDLLAKDLSRAAGGEVKVTLQPLSECLEGVSGTCLDSLSVRCDCYQVCPDLLQLDEEGVDVDEALFSHLLRSICPCTGQPDWGCVWIHYKGPKINHASLLQYIVSYRNHRGFHEQCVENIFMDLMHRCSPKHLSVCARYTRRGGLDINPCRSTDPDFTVLNKAWARQ